MSLLDPLYRINQIMHDASSVNYESLLMVQTAYILTDVLYKIMEVGVYILYFPRSYYAI
jgi:hypothetical protein